MVLEILRFSSMYWKKCRNTGAFGALVRVTFYQCPKCDPLGSTRRLQMGAEDMRKASPCLAGDGSSLGLARCVVP